MNTRIRVVFALTMMMVGVQQLSAQTDAGNFHFRAAHRPAPARNNTPGNPAPPANLYNLNEAFVALPPATNSDGTFLWPCEGTTAGNVDCPTIGNPSIPFPIGGLVTGVPQYAWSFADCDGNTTASQPCGQVQTWWEDDTNDTTDDFIYKLTMTQVQGGATVYLENSGTLDLGPNPYGGMTPPATVFGYTDLTMGTLGVPTGPNNGECYPDFNYPLTTISYPFRIAANATCVDPQPGLVTMMATIELATPKFTQNKKTGLYTVTYTRKYILTQKWHVWLQ
jgi:hypothetical protein